MPGFKARGRGGQDRDGRMNGDDGRRSERGITEPDLPQEKIRAQQCCSANPPRRMNDSESYNVDVPNLSKTDPKVRREHLSSEA